LKIEEQLHIIKRGTVDILSEEELKDKIVKKKKLRIKFGADPTAPDIHLGHTVIFRKLRQFQELGHEIIFIIGDFTARIGDPSGQLQTRPALSVEEILNNAKTYQEQVFKILDRNNTRIVFNSMWFDALELSELMKLTRFYTVARMLERDDFSKRYNEGKEITILEFIYPLLQGYDSVVLEADVEIGGTDQKFNLLVGRDLQRSYGQTPQVVITMPLLEGTDGVRKMSKSYGNYIGILEESKEMFGKLMSIPDAIMPKYFELLTDIRLEKIKDMHPKEAKQLLAREIVSFYYSKEEAIRCEEEFNRIFAKKGLPDKIPEFTISQHRIGIVELMMETGMVTSKSQARRLISQGGVKIDNTRIEDVNLTVTIEDNIILQVGKRRFVNIKLSKC
jgi:tyrosyl-tRNA synthetase